MLSFSALQYRFGGRDRSTVSEVAAKDSKIEIGAEFHPHSINAFIFEPDINHVSTLDIIVPLLNYNRQ